MNHSPAPWVVKSTIIGPASSVKVIGTKDGDLSDQEAIAMVPQTDETQVANTNLICAAPDLLNALRDLEFAVREFTNAAVVDWPELSRARAAIAKATRSV